MMCLTSPCFPTPQDVEILIQAGFGEDLMKTSFVDIRNFDIYDVIAPKAITMTVQTKNGDLATLNKCTFLDTQGFCKLHKSGLKPTEGKLANHTVESDKTFDLRVEICNTWTKPENLDIVSKLYRYYE